MIRKYILASSLICVAFNSYSQYIQKLPESTVDSYRLESQYGPEISVLNPLYPRDNKVELSLGAAYSPVSTIHNYYAFTGGALFHFNHRHAIEPIWAQYQQGDWTDFVTIHNPTKLLL
jgi:hypothetical protein